MSTANAATTNMSREDHGDANRPFDLGTGVLTPEETDWWLLRVAP